MKLRVNDLFSFRLYPYIKWRRTILYGSMNTAVYHCFHTWAVSHPTGVHSTVPSQSAPHQYDFSCAGPIRYMQPCVTLKTECRDPCAGKGTGISCFRYSLCTTVSIQKLPHDIDTPTYHCIGTVPYPYMTGVTFNRDTQYCPTTIDTALIKHFLYRTVPSLTALRHAKSRTDFWYNN